MNREGPPYFCTCGTLVDHQHDDCDACLADGNTDQSDGNSSLSTGPMASFEEVFGCAPEVADDAR